MSLGLRVIAPVSAVVLAGTGAAVALLSRGHGDGHEPAVESTAETVDLASQTGLAEDDPAVHGLSTYVGRIATDPYLAARYDARDEAARRFATVHARLGGSGADAVALLNRSVDARFADGHHVVDSRAPGADVAAIALLASRTSTDEAFRRLAAVRAPHDDTELAVDRLLGSHHAVISGGTADHPPQPAEVGRINVAVSGMTALTADQRTRLKLQAGDEVRWGSSPATKPKVTAQALRATYERERAHGASRRVIYHALQDTIYPPKTPAQRAQDRALAAALQANDEATIDRLLDETS